MDKLPEEIERVQKILVVYGEIGPAAAFASAMIRQDLKAASVAMVSGDVIGMLQAYNALKGYDY